MIQVLIVDDHAVVTDGIANILDPDMQADTAASGADALQLIQKKKFDVVLLDITMPDMNGLEALIQIKEVQPNLPVLMLSMHAEGQYALRCIKEGAVGYLNKSCERNELITAIQHAAAGKQYLTPAISKLMIEALRNPEQQDATHNTLSKREFQVFLLTAKGKSLTVVANELNLSPKTISTYRRRILEKTGLRNNSEIMHYAFEHGFEGIPV